MKSAVEEAERTLRRTHAIEDPWLLSFADLVTNLLAFFVFLVSLAQLSFESIEALPQAFDSSAAGQTQNLAEVSQALRELVRSESLRGVQTSIDEQGLAIRIEDRIVFDSGVADLSEEGRALVTRLAGVLVQMPERYRVLVEGHTDQVPIQTARFASNWELSAARALEVRSALEDAGVVKGRLAIAAYADTRPVERNGSPEAQAAAQRANRRVVIRVY